MGRQKKEADPALDVKKGKATTAAQRDLREAYPDEYKEFLRKRYAEQGVPWETSKLSKPTREEREKAQLATLLEQYPDEAQAILTNDAEARTHSDEPVAGKPDDE